MAAIAAAIFRFIFTVIENRRPPGGGPCGTGWVWIFCDAAGLLAEEGQLWKQLACGLDKLLGGLSRLLGFFRGGRVSGPA